MKGHQPPIVQCPRMEEEEGQQEEERHRREPVCRLLIYIYIYIYYIILTRDYDNQQTDEHVEALLSFASGIGPNLATRLTFLLQSAVAESSPPRSIRREPRHAAVCLSCRSR